jgi:hypothetical protein
MANTLQATVTAAGDQATLDAYRASLNAALAGEADVSLKELHTAGRLEWRLAARGGLPFPALVNASLDVPELEIRVEWQDAASGTGGDAAIQGGRLQRQGAASAAAQGGAQGVEVRADADGTIVLALACRREGEDWLGYALTDAGHAFFRVRPGPVLEATDGVELEWAERWRVGADGEALYAELDPREPLEPALASALGRLADAFAGDWVWFAADEPVDTAVERARFAAYGYPVREANLRSAKLRGVMRGDGDAFTFSSLDEAGRAIAALVARHWLQSERH